MTISIESIRATAEAAYPEFKWTIAYPMDFDGLLIMATTPYMQKLWFRKPQTRIAYAQQTIRDQEWMAVVQGEKIYIIMVNIEDVGLTLTKELAERKKKRVWK